MVTPPVALASFAAAGVGKASAMKTSMSAFGLSLVAFFIPFGFVFDPGILWQGTIVQIALSAIGLMVATSLWAVAFGGWCGKPLAMPLRVAIGLAGLAAVIEPMGSTVWILALVIGWGISLAAFFASRLSLGQLDQHLFVQPAE